MAVTLEKTSMQNDASAIKVKRWLSATTQVSQVKRACKLGPMATTSRCTGYTLSDDLQSKLIAHADKSYGIELGRDVFHSGLLSRSRHFL